MNGAKWLLRLLAIFLPLLLGIVGAEVYLRQTMVSMDDSWKQWVPQQTADCYAPSLSIGYVPRPSACGHDRWGMDAMGPKTDGASPRILVLGDSVTEHKHWVQTLSASLAQSPSTANAGVWVYAASGWDTCAEYAAFREVADVVRPDVVLVQACPNDIWPAMAVLPLPMANDTVRIFEGDQYRDIPRSVLRSRLLTFLAFQAVPAQGGKQESAGSRMQGCAMGLVQEIQARGGQAMAVVFPALSPLSARGAEVDSERVVGMLLEKAGFRVLPLRSAMETLGSLDTLRTDPRDNIHPSPAGHAAAGAAAAVFVQQALAGPPR